MGISNVFGRIKTKIETILYRNLVKTATSFTTAVKISIEDNNLPKAISDALSMSGVQSSDTGKYITVSISLITAPMAAAYEFGSGIHSTRGDQGKYTIEPKNASVLAFPWNPVVVPWRSPKFAGVQLQQKGGTKGQYFFHYVDHPGVEARPYIEPNLNKINKNILTELNNDIMNIFIGEFPLVEVNNG